MSSAFLVIFTAVSVVVVVLGTLILYDCFVLLSLQILALTCKQLRMLLFPFSHNLVCSYMFHKFIKYFLLIVKYVFFLNKIFLQEMN